MSYFGNTHLKQINTILQDILYPLCLINNMPLIAFFITKIKNVINILFNSKNGQIIKKLSTCCLVLKTSKILIYIQVGVLKLLVHPFTLIFFSLTYSFFLTNLFNGNFTDPITWIASVLINDPTIKSEDQDSNQEYYRIPTI